MKKVLSLLALACLIAGPGYATTLYPEDLSKEDRLHYFQDEDGTQYYFTNPDDLETLDETIENLKRKLPLSDRIKLDPQEWT